MKILICLKNGYVIRDDVPIKSLKELAPYSGKYNWLCTPKTLINASEIAYIKEDLIECESEVNQNESN